MRKAFTLKSIKKCVFRRNLTSEYRVGGVRNA
jgi:hypothetical protein